MAWDAEEVRSLLEDGTDVNAKSRYGATALSFAADRGNVDLVRLLIEHGADVDVQDSFYNSTPVNWTLFKAASSADHREALRLLLAAGAKDGGGVLAFAVQAGNRELVDLVIGAATLSKEDLQRAHELAEAGSVQGLTDRIDRALAELGAADGVPPPDRAPAYEPPAGALPRYEGTYRNEELGFDIRIFIESERLKLQVTGQPAMDLRPRAENEFDVAGVAEAYVAFSGRAGSVERLVLHQAGRDFTFGRIDGTAVTLTSPAPASATEPAADRAVGLPAAGRTEARNWPGFRGADHSGIADGQGAPWRWDGKSRQGVRFRTEIPGIGLSSPVIWNGRIFLTTAVSSAGNDSLRTGLYGDVDSVEDVSPHTWKVIAIDAASGKVVWERNAAQGVPKVKRHMKSSHANPTPVTDGEHLLVSFGSEGLFCYDLDGRLLWQRDLGVLNSGWFYDPTYEWGFSSSPIVYRGRGIVQVDIQHGSFIAAFDLGTGEPVWRTERDEIPTWGTPAILPASAPGMPDEVVTNGPTIRGYDAGTGAELWHLGPSSEVTVATPVIADGLAYVTANYPPVRPIYVLRPGQRGDLSLPTGQRSSAAVVWSEARGGVYIPTPIVYRGLLYMLNMNGRITAYDAKTGDVVYKERVGQADSFSASSVAADGRLYFTTEQGKTYVVAAGPEFALLAANELDEVVMSTPAISDGLMVMRTAQAVWGLEQAPPDGGR